MNEGHPTVGGTGFTVLSAADPGPIPEEVALALERAAEAVEGVVGKEPPGVVAVRFGRRTIVAPAASPGEAVDVADIDLPRRIVLTVGGLDPGPEGTLACQLLLLRSEALVAYVAAKGVAGPTMEVLEAVLPALRDTPGEDIDEVGRVVLASTAEELSATLVRLAKD